MKKKVKKLVRATKNFKLFEKYGIDNCKIILLELVNANSKDELHAREAYHIKSVSCVNRNIPLQTGKEYYKSTKDVRLAYQKLYDDSNKGKKKEYYNNNKDKIKERNRLTYQNKQQQLTV